MCHGKAACLVGSTLLQVAVPQPLAARCWPQPQLLLICVLSPGLLPWVWTSHCWGGDGRSCSEMAFLSFRRSWSVSSFLCSRKVLVASLILPWGSVCCSCTIRTSQSLRQAWASAASPALSTAWSLWRGTTPAWLAAGWKGACVGWGNGKQGQDGWWFWAPCHPDGPSGISSCWNMLCPPLL